MRLTRASVATPICLAAVLLIAGPAAAADPDGPAARAAWTTVVALAVVVAGVALVLRQVDVRLVLGLCAVPLFVMAGKFPEMLRVLAREMANPRTVVPIGSALGFAYVLNLTQCDKHLVHLLLRPLRRVRPLLIPGGIAAGYLVNTAIVSQTGAAAVVGPILIPLLLAGGVTPVTAGAALLLGCSMGGELFNPGAVEVVTLSRITGLTPPAVVSRMVPLNLLVCSVALLAFWRLAVPWERRDRPRVTEGGADGPSGGGNVPDEPFRVSPIKAIVPVVPLALLFAAPEFLPLPEGASAATRELTGSATILAAMLIGTVAAGLTSPSRAGKLSSAFFEGAGYAYTRVISLIVTGTTFAEGIKACGLLDALTSGLARLPSATALLLSVALPWILAVVTGSGIAPAVVVMQSLVPAAEEMGFEPSRLGTVIALAAHFGRTMSPVAAVVMLSATLSETSPVALVKRVIPPLLGAGLVLFLVVWLRLA